MELGVAPWQRAMVMLHLPHATCPVLVLPQVPGANLAGVSTGTKTLALSPKATSSFIPMLSGKGKGGFLFSSSSSLFTFQSGSETGSGWRFQIFHQRHIVFHPSPTGCRSLADNRLAIDRAISFCSPAACPFETTSCSMNSK